MKVINLYGGPGTGKSTTAAALFSLMKWEGYNVELVDEYAKQLTWEKRFETLSDQMYITAKQHRKIFRLKDQVDYVITDSPIVMCLPYVAEDYVPEFKPLVCALFNQYDNLNVFLNRKKKYNPIGRNQTEEEARGLDKQINGLLDNLGITYYHVDANKQAGEAILDMIKTFEKYENLNEQTSE